MQITSDRDLDQSMASAMEESDTTEDSISTLETQPSTEDEVLAPMKANFQRFAMDWPGPAPINMKPRPFEMRPSPLGTIRSTAAATTAGAAANLRKSKDAELEEFLPLSQEIHKRKHKEKEDKRKAKKAAQKARYHAIQDQHLTRFRHKIEGDPTKTHLPLRQESRNPLPGPSLGPTS